MNEKEVLLGDLRVHPNGFIFVVTGFVKYPYSTDSDFVLAKVFLLSSQESTAYDCGRVQNYHLISRAG